MGESTGFYIDGTLIILSDYAENHGEINISDPKMGRYSMYWSAMGSDIRDFLLRTNSDYFADKLLGIKPTQVFESFCSEPWSYIETKDSKATEWLKSLHNKLKDEINKQKSGSQPKPMVWEEDFPPDNIRLYKLGKIVKIYIIQNWVEDMHIIFHDESEINAVKLTKLQIKEKYGIDLDVSKFQRTGWQGSNFPPLRGFDDISDWLPKNKNI